MGGRCNMWPFKKKAIKEIDGGAWGDLVSSHGLDAVTLSREFRCVEREGSYEGRAVTLLRVFKPSEAEKKESLFQVGKLLIYIPTWCLLKAISPEPIKPTWNARGIRRAEDQFRLN
jgi:hypothetical protein